MNVIVTGGTGFLGNALVNELAYNGDNVTVLVRPESSRINRVKGINRVKIIETPLDENIILPEDKYNVFFHLAWEGERNNFDSQYKNVNITLNCLNVAATYGCKTFICTGSQAEYGQTDEIITEDTLINPTTSYGAAKAAAFFLSKDLARHFGIKHIWARVFSVYGDNDNANTLYSQLTRALSTVKEYRMSTDGLHMWNFLCDTDAARALRLLSGNDVDGGIYNVASKNSRPLYEYVEMLKQSIAPSAIITYGEQRCKVNLNTSSDKLRNTIGEYEKSIFPGSQTT